MKVEFSSMICTFWHSRENWSNGHRQASAEITLKSFRVNGKAWTLSCSVFVDSSWDDTGDCGELVDITREKFKDLRRPDAIEFLPVSVHCDISPLVLSSGLEEATKVPVRCFSKPPKHPWIPYGNTGFLTSQCGVLCWGGLCANEEFEKALPVDDMDHPAAASPWSEMLVHCALGRNNEGCTHAARPAWGCLPRRWGPLARFKHILLAWTSENHRWFVLYSACKLRRWLTSRTWHCRLPPLAGCQDELALLNSANCKKSTSKSSSLSGEVRKRCSLPNSRFPKIVTYGSSFSPVPLLWHPSYELLVRMDCHWSPF